MNATQQAKEAYKQNLANKAEQDAAYRKTLEPHAIEDCKELFGREPDEVDGSHVVLDGLTFILNRRSEAGRMVNRREVELHCSDCEDVYFKTFYDLAALGEILETPQTHGYRCPKYPKANVDTKTRLADAIRELLDEN